MHNRSGQDTDSGPLAAVPSIEIRPFQTQQDATAFRTLNEEWIRRYFTMEPLDEKNLGDPQGKILSKGGEIFLACLGPQTVGCVALIPIRPGIYELSKMAVAPEFRGLGIGRKLLQHAIAEARHMGAESLFLRSNSRLQDAVHLYESVGFRHVAAEQFPETLYARSNVFMELLL
jgi:putative acetyltransferase